MQPVLDFKEFFPFADQYLKGGVPMPVISRPELKDGQLTAQVKAATKLVSARLHYTTSPHEKNKSRAWTTRKLSIEEDRIKGEGPPEEATVWYVDLTDERKILVSSEVFAK